jgi:hypothetical protein
MVGKEPVCLALVGVDLRITLKDSNLGKGCIHVVCMKPLYLGTFPAVGACWPELEQAKSISGGWVQQFWYSHTMEYHAATKMKGATSGPTGRDYQALLFANQIKTRCKPGTYHLPAMAGSIK